MSSKLPDANPIPDRPPLHLRGGFLCVASPVDITEACLSVPAVRALRHCRPNSTMAVLCPESLAPIWGSMGELNHVIEYPDTASARQISKILLAHQVTFESAIAWEASEAAKAFQRANILQRLGYPAKGLGKYLTDPVERLIEPGPIQHRVRHYLNLVQDLGGKPYVAATFTTPPLELAPVKPVIGLAPYSEYGTTYQWPVERFKELVETYEKSHGEVEWVILSTNDQATSENAKLAEMLEGRVKQRDLHLKQAVIDLPHLTAMVLSDNVLGHLASAAGLPSVVIFGPNEPEWRRPLGKQSRVLCEHVACSPCYLTKCPLDMRCQNEISVESVVENLHEAVLERAAQ